MPPPLLTLEDIDLSFGGEPILDGASLVIEPMARIALVGRNGSGKSTLLKIAAGLIEPDDGVRFIDPGCAIAYLPQDPDLSGFETVGAYVEAALPMSAQGALGRLYAEFGIDPDMSCATLSGGETRRAALVRLFAGKPDAMLLDEPTNHLDLPAIEALETRLAASRAAIAVISHDRRFLETLTTRTVWLDRGKARFLDRGFKDFESWRDKVLEEEETAAHKLDRKILAEEHWVRYGVTARRKRNVRRMRELGDLRRERRDRRRATGAVEFSVNEASASGKRVILAEGVSKSFGGRAIVDDFSIEIARGDRVGIVGPNGAGKTTLLKLLTGETTPDIGRVRLGAGLEMITLDQRRASLRDDDRVADAITDGRGDWVSIGEEKRHVATYLKDFLFKPEQWRTPVGALSGGERGRLALAAALAKPSNLLVLDEPTNDLDLETLDLLEELVADYKGTLLIVSHDRDFLNKTVTSIVSLDPSGKPGQWTEYAGGYDDMIAQRGAAPVFAKQAVKLAAARPAAEAPAARSKLSFKEKFALEQLPARIDALMREITTLKSALGDPSLFRNDAKAFAAKAKALEEAQSALAAAEEEWLALEMKREALEA
ncbi:MAG: ABC-F family ATP-binding cassette domain-containing protein [Parvularculaceae bacterium]|nr:ABC-F family ATP-binding cassette domain-containing protein [Parvularculaceae bacterium]